jgi:hypothetical protein
VPVIDTPSATLTWAVGDPISFSGHATDPVQGPLPASALTWSEIIHHCTTVNDCHTHTIQTSPGVAGGSLNAPDHDYPSWLELQLVATNSSGQTGTTSVRLDPKTVDLTFTSNPAGLTIAINDYRSRPPFARTVIVNSANSISAAHAVPQRNNLLIRLLVRQRRGAQHHRPDKLCHLPHLPGVRGGVPVNTSPPTLSGWSGRAEPDRDQR